MGNIEIKERPKRSHSIFKPRSKSRSPFKQVIYSQSPYYQHFSPIRYSHDSRSLKKSSLKGDSRQASTRLQERSSMISPKAQMSTIGLKEVEFHENRDKCNEIIKKVRNFNDFLLELKKKLRSDCHMKEGQENKSAQVNMSVRLQNQRVQLEKYKKLVKRELSKTHSISSINIEELKNGQKMLTIHYENLPLSTAKSSLPIPEQQAFESPITGSIESQFPSNRQEVAQQEGALNSEHLLSAFTRMDCNKEMQKIKHMFLQLKNHCYQLGKSLVKQESEQADENSKDFLLRCRQKAVRIDQLFQEVQSANTKSLEIQSKVRRCLL